MYFRGQGWESRGQVTYCLRAGTTLLTENQNLGAGSLEREQPISHL